MHTYLLIYFSLNKIFLSESGVPPNSVLFGGTVPPNSVLFGGTVPPNSFPHQGDLTKSLFGYLYLCGRHFSILISRGSFCQKIEFPTSAEARLTLIGLSPFSDPTCTAFIWPMSTSSLSLTLLNPRSEIATKTRGGGSKSHPPGNQ